MRRFSSVFSFLCVGACSVLIGAGCASKSFFKDDSKFIENKEFERLVTIKKGPEPEPVPETPVEAKPAEKADVKAEEKKPEKKAAAAIKPPVLKKAKDKAVEPHLPKLEDAEGFDGRRPMVDPFHVGEKAVFDVTYFGIRAGIMTLETLPFSQVNGRTNYHFRIRVESSPTFSSVYTVDDVAETFVDYETMVPSVHTVNIKESKQKGDIRSFFDWKENRAQWWETKVSAKGKTDKKYDWKIEPYSQNVISALFYLRAFTMRENKDIAYRVADAGDNIVFSAKYVRKEKITTAAGAFSTIVIKPTITVSGVFKPVGDVFIWLTDDDRKQIVRIEMKIKIGTLTAKLRTFQRGQ